MVIIMKGVKGQSLTGLKYKIILKIISDEELLKALVINDEDFLDVVPTEEQNQLLQSPINLIRTQIFPYKFIPLPSEIEKTYITTSFVNFRKVSNIYKNGVVYFYIIIPRRLEKTSYGLRYDFIADRLEELFENGNIGEFELDERGDLDFGEKYLGHYVRFKIKDFYGW